MQPALSTPADLFDDPPDLMASGVDAGAERALGAFHND